MSNPPTCAGIAVKGNTRRLSAGRERGVTDGRSRGKSWKTRATPAFYAKYSTSYAGNGQAPGIARPGLGGSTRVDKTEADAPGFKVTAGAITEHTASPFGAAHAFPGVVKAWSDCVFSFFLPKRNLLFSSRRELIHTK